MLGVNRQTLIARVITEPISCCTHLSTHVSQIIQLFFLVFFFQTSLVANGELNNFAIREVLSTHKKLASSTTLTKDTQDLCLEIYKKFQAIELEIAKRDPGFLEVRFLYDF